MSKKKVGVVLSGCGVYDGAEIHEAVLTLLALDLGLVEVEAVCFAPNVDQAEVVDHVTGKPKEVRRNVLQESARIARGNIADLATAKADGLDAVVFPGGFGAAKNLCDFAVKGEQCEAHPEVARLVKEMVDARKPVAAACIAPALLAKVLGRDKHVSLTIGTDKDTGSKLTAMGATHKDCPVTEFVVDRENKVVSTPAYMLATRISEVAEGIDKMVRETLALI